MQIETASFCSGALTLEICTASQIFANFLLANGFILSGFLCSKFLFISRDEAEGGNVTKKILDESKDIVKCLTVICRNTEHIPLVSSMDFVKNITQMVTLFLQHLLEMEATFFVPKGKRKTKEQSTQKLRDESMDLIIQCCHFLEGLYDPYFRWRAYLCGKDAKSGLELPPTPIALHQETIPFLYESFETALVDCFPQVIQPL